MRNRLAAVCTIALGMAVGVASAQSPRRTANNEHPKISMKQARTTALAREQGTIKSSELEREHSRLIYSFDIQTKHGIREVNVDAMTGKVVEDSKESRADEAREAAQERKADRRHNKTQKQEPPK